MRDKRWFGTHKSNNKNMKNHPKTWDKRLRRLQKRKLKREFDDD